MCTAHFLYQKRKDIPESGVCQVKCVNFFVFLSVAVKTTDFYI